MKNLSILTFLALFLCQPSFAGYEGSGYDSYPEYGYSSYDYRRETIEDMYMARCGVGRSYDDNCEELLDGIMFAKYDCWECVQQEESGWNTAIKYGAGPLASVLNTFIGSYYGYKTNKTWANAYQQGASACPQSITDTLPEYLTYLNDRGAPPMLPDQLTALYGECNGQSLGSFAGFGNGFHPYMNQGFSQGFLSGILGPQVIGGGMYGGGMYGGGMMGPRPIYPGGMPGGMPYPGGMPPMGYPGGMGACITAPCPFGANGGMYGQGFGHGQFGLNGGLNISLGANTFGHGYANVNGGLNAYGNMGLGAQAYGHMNPGMYGAYAGAGMTYPGPYQPQYGGYIDPASQQVRMMRSTASMPQQGPGGYYPQQQQPYYGNNYPMQPNYGYNQLMGMGSVGANANGYLNGGFNFGIGGSFDSRGNAGAQYYGY